MANLIFGNWYDHISRNTFDNRKINIRKCTIQENTINHPVRTDNTSGVIGVSYHKKSCKWRAYININKKVRTLGCYFKFEDAVVARLKAEKQYYGEFAPQKHLYEKYNIM